MNETGKIYHKNIRATADPDFWGDQYEESLYLCCHAKHALTLREMDEVMVPTLNDPLASKERLRETQDFSRALYHKYIVILAGRLNRLHKLDMPEKFWQTVFGFWLYRHICVVYDKYLYLRQLDVERTDIKLLSSSSFHIPNDHVDYARCFCNDHGVLQLVSDYYYLFAKKEFETVEKQYEPDQEGVVPLNPLANLIIGHGAEWCESQWWKKLPRAARAVSAAWVGLLNQQRWTGGRKSREYGSKDDSATGNNKMPLMALFGAFYGQQVLNELWEKSGGKISAAMLPIVVTHEMGVDHNGRAFLSDIDAEDPFDKYLVSTFSYSIPKILVEYFLDYYHAYSQCIERGRCTHIVTEVLPAFMPVSIYCAIARQKCDVKLVIQQHGASQQWLCGCPDWMEVEVADVFVTTGWQGSSKKIMRGGFAVRDVAPYKFEPWKVDILHVCTTTFRYRCDFYGIGASGRFVEYLQKVASMIDTLPARLRGRYVLRPRRLPNLWDTEHSWEVQQKGIRVDAESALSSLLAKARIVIVDQLSSSIAEILRMEVPCLILHYDDIEPLADEYSTLFDDLKACGVVHGSAASAIEHLSRIYDDVEGWWSQDNVQHAIRKITSETLGPPSRTVECLMSLLEPDGAGKCA